MSLRVCKSIQGKAALACHPAIPPRPLSFPHRRLVAVACELVRPAMADKLTRIAIVNSDKCKPKKCRQECKKSCPVVRMGTLVSYRLWIPERYSSGVCLCRLVQASCASKSRRRIRLHTSRSRCASVVVSV